MNEIFESKRFGKYFITDLKNCWNNYSISFIILCSVPVISAIIVGLWGMILSGHEWASLSLPVRVGFYGISYFVILLSMSPKMYGYVTDKKRGSTFLMIPVSSFEKTLSMLLTTIIFGLVLFLGCYYLLDALICIVDKGCGDSILYTLTHIEDMSIEELGINSLKSVFSWTFVSQGINTFFVFLFGAVFFKKSKAAKTILSLFGIAIVFGMFASFIIPNININEYFAMRIINSIPYLGIILNLIFALGMGVATFFRIKTLKH